MAKAVSGKSVDEAAACDNDAADDAHASHVPNFPVAPVDVNAWNKVGTRFADCLADVAEEEDSDEEEGELEPRPFTCIVASTDTMPGDKVDVVAWKGVGANIKNALSLIMDEDSEDEFLPRARKLKNDCVKSASIVGEEEP